MSVLDADDFNARALAFGRDTPGHGKIEILPKVTVRNLADMAVAYTPGAGHVVRHLLAYPDALEEQTARGNMIALVTDGTAVMGFGDVGPTAAIPVMEGKAAMFKALAGLDCMPLCLAVDTVERFCEVVAALEPTFCGINLEDVAAPSCFAVVEALEARLSIPVMHDDQFGTATVITAGLLNAFALTGRTPGNVRAVVNGVGAAGTATIQMLETLGVGEIVAVDRHGILCEGDDLAHQHWREIAARTNRGHLRGGLAEAMRGADVFVGVSSRGLVDAVMVRSMAQTAIVFALANPEPEIMPNQAMAAGAAVAASGRFDFPNQCNNVLAFPGLMRGAVASRAKRVSTGMCLAAAQAIAAAVPELAAHRILPSPLDLSVHAAVAEATAQAAVAEGLARRVPLAGAVAELTRALAERVAGLQRAP